jgi:hypothetical protein
MAAMRPDPLLRATGRDLPQRTDAGRVMTDPIPTKKTDGFPPSQVPNELTGRRKRAS